jgi:hypothetical protein
VGDEMSKLLVRIPIYADFMVEVEADSEAEAISKCADISHWSLCHHCSNHIELGEQDLSGDVTAEAIDDE